MTQVFGSKTRDFTWSPVRRYLWADGVGSHDNILVVDSRVRLLVYHLIIQKSMSLHWHTCNPFLLTLSINEWVDLHLMKLVDLRQIKWKLFPDGFLLFAFEE